MDERMSYRKTSAGAKMLNGRRGGDGIGRMSRRSKGEERPKRPKSAGLARFYSRIGARGWQSSNYFTFSVRSPALRGWLAAQLPARRLRILSVGCGSGELEAHLARCGHAVVGLDLSTPMLKRARKRGLTALVQGDSQALPFRAQAFDAVIFPECVGYLHLPTAFAEAVRVLRPRGRLLITTYAGAVKLHTAYARAGLDEIGAALATCGLRLAEHRFLAAKRSSITPVAPDAEATLLYVRAAHASRNARTEGRARRCTSSGP